MNEEARKPNTSYPTPGPSAAPTTDKPTISEEYLQHAMDDWPKTDVAEPSHKTNTTDSVIIDLTTAEDETEDDNKTKNNDDHTNKTSQNPTTDRQGVYFCM